MTSTNKRYRTLLATLLVVLVATISLASTDSASAVTNLVDNGDFESGSTDWTFTNTDIVTSAFPHNWDVYDGVNALDLNGSNSGSITQTIDTDPGNKYRVEFRLSANPQCGSEIKTLTGSGGDNPGTSFSFLSPVGASHTSLAWAEQQFFFVADGSSETVSFVSNTPGFCGAMLDAIIVTDEGPPLPTSGTQCKKGGWEDYGIFKNQGDCVSFVATNGNNPPAYG